MRTCFNIVYTEVEAAWRDSDGVDQWQGRINLVRSYISLHPPVSSALFRRGTIARYNMISWARAEQQKQGREGPDRVMRMEGTRCEWRWGTAAAGRRQLNGSERAALARPSIRLRTIACISCTRRRTRTSAAWSVCWAGVCRNWISVCWRSSSSPPTGARPSARSGRGRSLQMLTFGDRTRTQQWVASTQGQERRRNKRRQTSTESTCLLHIQPPGVDQTPPVRFLATSIFLQ